MPIRNRILAIILIVVMLTTSCVLQPVTAPTPTLAPRAVPTAPPGPAASPTAGTGEPVGATGSPAATPGPARLVKANLFPPGLSSEPLTVLSTQPADKTAEVAVGKALTSVVVQFNHPVVPLVSVSAQKTLPQPLTLRPPVPGQGEWVNTSTYSFTPTEDLAVATAYTVTVATLKDLLGQELAGYTWTFQTASPSIAKTYPEGNSRYAGTGQPITVTFNTAMDRPSTESRFSLSTGGAAVSGRFEWSDSVMRFVPDKPLAYNTSYQSTLKAGAKDAKLVAATTKDLAWSFTTVQQPAVLSTMPANGAKDAQTQRTSFQVVFASPMARDDLRVTIQPTITNYYSNWQYDSNDTILRLSGSWQPSQSYTVTISGQSRDRDGEALAKDTVVRFTTAPLEPQMWLNTAGPMGLYDVDGPQTIYATCINVERVDFSLFRVDRASFLSLINRNKDKSGGAYTPASSSLVRSWSQAVSSPLNASSLVSTTLSSAGPLQPGIYYLQAGSPNVTNKAGYLLVATRYNLLLKHTDKEALLWVTSLATGKPVAGAALTLLDTSSNVIATGASDADGLFHTPIQLTNPYDSVYAVVESDGQVVAAVGSDWANGINPWDFNLSASRGSVPYYGQMDTDRAIYQPGQSVFYKGILRADDDAVYSLPNLDSVIVEARDFQGRQVFSSTMPLSPFGTFNGEIKLAEGASTGGYVLSVKTGNQADDRIYASMTFQVAEYRRPEFQVAVSLDKPEYVNGDTISATATASYFFGGAVADAAVTWRLMSEDYFFSSDLIKGYWDFSDWDYTVGRRAQGKVLSEGKGKTDKQGGFSFSLPADLSEFQQSQSFTLEADVTDINNQAVASRTTVIVHKGQVYIGLRPQRYVGSAGDEQAVDVISVDTKGITVANQAVTVSFYQREWYSARVKQTDGSFVWQSAYTDTFAFKDEVKTDANGAAVAAFTPLHGGTYRAVADAVDARGNKVRSATYLWVSDSAFVNWRMDNNDRVDLIADKKQYAPGETADILVPAPFANAEALLTIERGSIREVRRLFLTGNSARVQIPILPDYAPNVYVSILMVKGRGPDSPLPQFKLGYVNLSVSTQEKQLSVKLTPDRAAYSPGDKATFSLEATDYTGKPVEAEFSLALVDKAVQSLADSRSLSPLQAFYGERSLSIVTAVSWSSAVERLNQTLRPEAKGGGGDAQDGSVRRDFKDTAYWNPSVVTDKAGRAQVTVTLPDNLTTWNMAAKGVTSGTLVGQASADILSSKDLLVRPVIPRFFVVGDKARLEAVVNNNTGQAIAADVRLDAQGLAVAGNAQQSVNIPANDKAKVGWDVTVAAVDQVVLKFSASGGGRQDALEQTLPVRRPTSPETVATAGQVETKIAEQIQVPAAADTSAGELRIALSPSLAAASNDSLRYLESYAYESSEQTASKLLPNVATYQALRKLGIERPDLKQSLAVNATRQVQRLYALQNQDGGWGWWGGETSRPVLTAYALLALYSAQQGGFAVDPGVLSRAEQFLNNYLNQPIDAGASYVYNERAFAVFVLTEIGSAGTSSRAVNIFDQRASLDIYAKAYLLMALDKLDLPQAKTILAEIGSAAIASATGSHWEEKQTDYWGMNTNTRTTALVIMALARADSKNANLASAVRWLMTARKGDHWQTTQETAWSVLALTEFMVTSGELQARYTYQVTINDKPLGSGAVDENNVDQTQEMSVTIKDLLQATGNDLTIIRSPGSGQLYYSAYLNYYLPADTIAPLNRGIVLGRQYFAVDGATLQPTDRLIESAVVGDYVQVKLTLVAPADLHYLILEDALPAGFEAVDTTLKTSSAAANSPEMMKDPSLKSQSVVAKGWFSPYWQYWTQSEIRDDRVVLFATSLGRGVYEYTYIMRASLAGQFRTLPAQAWETYFPDVFGRSDGTLFTVQ